MGRPAADVDVMLAVAVLLVALGLALCFSSGGAEAQQDSVAPSVTWERVGGGDTLVVPEGRTVFWVDRPELNRLRVRQEQDSVRIARRDSALRDYAAAVDSMGSALHGCRQQVAGLEAQVEAVETKWEAEREARRALQDVHGGGLSGFLFAGPSGFVSGSVVGLTAGVLACRGANR